MLDNDQIARVIYLGVLATVLIGYAVISRQQQLGQMLRHAVLWGLLFVGVAAGYGLWQDVRAPAQIRATGTGALELRAERDGHFHVTLSINGVPVRAIVDTGATQLVLSRMDASRVGFDPATLPYLAEGRTANGPVRLARVVLDEVVLSEGALRIRDTRVPALVSEGALEVTLLGMGYLRRFARIRIEGDLLVLER